MLRIFKKRYRTVLWIKIWIDISNKLRPFVVSEAEGFLSNHEGITPRYILLRKYYSGRTGKEKHMILSTGVDIIEIDRFAQWHTYSHKQLRKIYSQQEIDYCLADSQKSAQRFAVRFALREALYKAVRVASPDCRIPFLTLCKAITIISAPRTPPQITLDWQILPELNPAPKIHSSLSHSKTMAVAQVILERR